MANVKKTAKPDEQTQTPDVTSSEVTEQNNALDNVPATEVDNKSEVTDNTEQLSSEEQLSDAPSEEESPIVSDKKEDIKTTVKTELSNDKKSLLKEIEDDAVKIEKEVVKEIKEVVYSIEDYYRSLNAQVFHADYSDAVEKENKDAA